MTASALKVPAAPDDPGGHDDPCESVKQPVKRPDEASASPPPAGVVAPRCRHGLMLTPPAMHARLECRVCVSPTETVDEWIAEHPEPTHAEIGAVFGVTRERVRQIEERALNRLDPKLAMLLVVRLCDRGDVVSEQEHFARIVRRMLAEGFETDEIVEALNVPPWRVGNVLRPNGRRTSR